MTPSAPAIKEHEAFVAREPFVMPPNVGNEETEVYVTAIKSDSPFETETIGGVCFSKYTYPADSSRLENRNRPKSPRYATYRLTEKQYEAMVEELKNRTKTIPPRPNVDFNPYRPEMGKEYFDEEIINVYEWLYFKKQKDFNPYEEEMSKYERSFSDSGKIEDESQKLAEEIYNRQAKRKKK